MNASDRLHRNVLEYANGQVALLLQGAGPAVNRHKQLVAMMDRYCYHGIITDSEAACIKSRAKMALDNSFSSS